MLAMLTTKNSTCCNNTESGMGTVITIYQKNLRYQPGLDSCPFHREEVVQNSSSSVAGYPFCC